MNPITLVLLAYLLLGLMTLIHEIGHAVAARLVSSRRVKIVVGFGPSILLRFKDFDLEIHAVPCGGHCSFPTQGFTVAQLRRFYYSGPLASMLAAVGLSWLAIAAGRSDPALGRVFAFAVLWAISSGLGNLVVTQRRGGRSDGTHLHALRHLPRDTVLTPDPVTPSRPLIGGP